MTYCQHFFQTLRWRHDGRDGIPNHQCHHCLLNCLFRHRSKKTSKLSITGLCEGNSPVTGEFPAQMARNMENVSIWWRHHVIFILRFCSSRFAKQCDNLLHSSLCYSSDAVYVLLLATRSITVFVMCHTLLHHPFLHLTERYEQITDFNYCGLMMENGVSRDLPKGNYLNQCWLIIGGVQWESPEESFTFKSWDINNCSVWENYKLKITTTSARVQLI